MNSHRDSSVPAAPVRAAGTLSYSSVHDSVHESAGVTSQTDLPWSHRISLPWRLMVSLCSGALTAVFGTLIHRAGASANLPYGLVLALAIIGLSTWCARSRSGVTGLALHLIASSLVAWVPAFGIGGDVLTPAGFGSAVPFFSQYAGYTWLFGMIVVQMVLLVLPARCFTMVPTRKRGDDE